MTDVGKSMQPCLMDWPENLLTNLGIREIDPVRRLGLRGEVEVAMILARLTEHEQDTIRNRYMLGMSLEEVGHATGVTKQCVHGYERRAMLRLMIPGSDSEFILVNGLTAWLDFEVEKRMLLRVQKLELKRTEAPEIESEGRCADEINLGDLGLCPRAYNALRRAHIDTLGDLYTKIHDYQDLIHIHGIGTNTGREIIKILREQGLPYKHLLERE